MVNTLFWVVPIVFLSFFKFLPIKPWQRLITYALDSCASAWISINGFTQNITTKIKWDITGLDKLSPKEWYLVVSNHQSWVDILVLQRIFNRRIPFLKFFLKKELIYVPFLGVAWWALDFPFMKRYSRKFLEKHPHLKGKDIETTRKSCEKFKHKPVSVMNFLEGTRFTPVKHNQQASPYQYLLTPKAGGIAFVLNAMGEHLTKLLNVTIYYPKKVPTFWDFISGKVNEISVRVDVQNIDRSLIGDYSDDPEFKSKFQLWVNQLWQAKDAELKQLTKHEVN